MRTLAGMAALAVIFASGCAGEKLTTAVVAFDTTVQGATTQHKLQLDRVLALREAEIKKDLASTRTPIAFSPDECEDLLKSYTPENKKACVIVKPGPSGDPIPIDENPLDVAKLKKLATLLAGYASALAALTGDVTADQEEFRKSVSGVATSVAQLQGQITDLGVGVSAGAENLGPIAEIIGELGSLYFEYQRSAALRRIIEQTDPFVQNSVKILAPSSDASRFIILARTSYDEMVEAKGDAVAKSNAPSSTLGAIKAAHKKLFLTHATFVAAASNRSAFEKIGEAHAQLAKVAKDGLSAEDMTQIMTRLLEAAERIDTSIDKLG